MRILIIHNYYQQQGGERAAVRAQMDLLQERGHRLILYSRDNAEIDSYNVAQKAIFFPNTLYSARTYREVQDLISREQPAVAHVHNVFPLISPSVYEALGDAGVPIVQTLHNFRFLCPNALFYTHGEICERCKGGNMLHAVRWRCYRQNRTLSGLYAIAIMVHRFRRTLDRIDRFIALSSFSAHKFIESGVISPGKLSVLGNFLPEPLPVPGPAASPPYIVFMGRLASEKGLPVLLDAAARLPDLPVRIAGTGPEQKALQAMVRQRGLHHVSFLGRVEGDAKWDLLRGACAVVAPSLCYENFPLVVLESFAVGTPVVASDLGSLATIITPGQNGLLFRPSDGTDLAQKLAWLYAHPQEAAGMGRQGRLAVEKQFSAEAHYAGLMAIYHAVLSCRRMAP